MVLKLACPVCLEKEVFEEQLLVGWSHLMMWDLQHLTADRYLCHEVGSVALMLSKHCRHTQGYHSAKYSAAEMG